MYTMSNVLTSPLLLFFLLSSSLALFNVEGVGTSMKAGRKLVGESPYAAKASFIRYWKRKVSSDLPEPWFLNKASPLNGVQLAKFSKLADQNLLTTQLPAFCSEANLLCSPEVSPHLAKSNEVFTTYFDRNFTNYGTKEVGGFDSFNMYAPDEFGSQSNTFTTYSSNSIRHDDRFSGYGGDTDSDHQHFNTYGTSATGGTGNFSNYGDVANFPDLTFDTYSDNAHGRKQAFTSYSNAAGDGAETFNNYGGNADGAAATNFTSYAQSADGMNSSFTSYGINAPNQTFGFTTYGVNTTFKNYPKNGVSFADYKNGSANSGLTTEAKSSDGVDVNFWKDYAKNGSSISGLATEATANKRSGVNTIKRGIEPGKFFREDMLKAGKVMPMPDICDKLPKRSFLPQRIVSKLPFSSVKITEMHKTFRSRENSAMSGMIKSALNECERSPSPGETKQCVGSPEDMVDFATSVLGRNVAVKTTENTYGSKSDILIGSVKAINGGKLTKSVSCHQSLFPYLLYYCHSVPKVRLYEVEILNPTSKVKINHGVAICHIDTSSWSPNHGAFVALGPGPGKIEVCHWIFENDLTWTIAD